MIVITTFTACSKNDDNTPTKKEQPQQTTPQTKPDSSEQSDPAPKDPQPPTSQPESEDPQTPDLNVPSPIPYITLTTWLTTGREIDIWIDDAPEDHSDVWVDTNNDGVKQDWDLHQIR